MSDHSELKTAATRVVEVQASQDVPIGKLWDEFDSLASPEAVLALIAEVEALRKDSDRYKWLSVEGNWVARMFGKWRAHVGEYGDSAPTEWHDTREEAIDVAMTKGSKP